MDEEILATMNSFRSASLVFSSSDNALHAHTHSYML